VAALAVAASLALVPAASAIDRVDSKKLRKGVTVAGIMEHQREFQRIANANDGNRAATTTGYDASVAYVQQRLEAAGYDVKLEPFEFAQWEQNGPSTLERISPDPAVFVEDTDYILAQFAAGGDVTADVFVAGNTEVPPSGGAGTSVSGCDPADFAGAAGKIALIQRGTCPFTQKYENADEAGAAAALIFNDGFEGREDPILTTGPTDMSIPAAMISNDLGEELYNQAQSGPVSVHFVVDATTTPITQYNVTADTAGNPDRTIVVGAHLDSVEEGPGINDNGSGSSGILEIAEEMAELKREPRNRVRFAWWGAEEAGLVGSTAYVEDLTPAQLRGLEANLNFDMIGSPNFVRFVYDGDLSDSAPPPSGAPAGSAQIEDMFLRYFDSRGLATDPTAFDGRSDYGPFIEGGVPAGGLFTGAEGIKTEEQEAVYGGAANVAFDPCYHQACDTLFNLSNQALNQMSDAAAHATFTLAQSRSPVTVEQGSSLKDKRGKKTRRLAFQGPFRVR
jgi:Zn-dependent M28 family amino/carboxypeptidase